MKRNLLPTAVAVFILSTCLAFSSDLNFANENCPPSDVILNMTGDSDYFEITLEAPKANEIVICNLEVGKKYFVSVEDVLDTDCKKSPVFNGGTINSSIRDQFQATTDCYHLTLSNPCNLPNSVILAVKKDQVNNAQSNLMKMVPITTNSSLTPTELIEDVFIGGGCFDVTNVQAIGPSAGIGSFSNGLTSVGFQDGVVLSTGNITNVVGPNTSAGVSTNFGAGGDPQLNQITPQSVNDAVGIEFDFSPTLSTIQFRFVFASDEYCEWVNSNFNDVFGFFISGPGINGPYQGNAENIAVLEGTNTAITINTVNNTTNPEFFNPNSTGCGGVTNTADIEFDGYTTVITATATVIPCSTYHIKLVVGDGTDFALDSAVFLEAGSFNAGGQATVTGGAATGSGVVYEDCGGDGFITFVRETGDVSLPLDITYTINPASTATPGADYSPLPPNIIIPAGQTEVTIPISAFADNITEGIETIIIDIDNSCSCISSSTTIEISDVPPIDIIPLDDQSLCNSQVVTLAPVVTGGVPPLIYNWSNGGGNSPSISPLVTQTTTYTLNVTDACGQMVSTSATIEIGQTATGFVSGLGSICPPGNPSTAIQFDFTGTGPWDLFYTLNGVLQPPILGITDNPFLLLVNQTGTYEIGQLNSNGCPGVGGGQAVVEETIIEPFLLPTDVSCWGNNDGSINTIPGGIGPFTYSWSNPLAGSSQNPTNLPAGTYTVVVTDPFGCTGSAFTIIQEPDPIFAETTGSSVNCFNPNGGSINLTVTGGTQPLFYNWSNGSNMEDPENLSPGTYTVTVSDFSGCQTTATAIVDEDFTPPTAAANAPNSLGCSGAPVTINGNGSTTAGVTYLWTTQTGNILSGETTLTPSVNQPGTYQIVVTNTSNGCTDVATVTVTETIDLPNAAANAPQILDCNNTQVMINGNGSSTGNEFTYMWTTIGGNIVSGNSTLTPTVNGQGEYILTVTNTSNGCTQTASVDVTENITPPSANAGFPQAIDCDNAFVVLNGSGSLGPNFTYLWTTTNGQILLDETTLSPTVGAEGTYQLVVTNTTNGCTNLSTVMVTADNDLPVANAGTANDLTCNTTQVTLNGGASSTGSGYTYLWTTQDGTILNNETTIMPTVGSTGTYQIQVTAPNGCTALATVTVGENTTPPIANAGMEMNIDCNASVLTLDGSGSSSNSTYMWTTQNGNILSGETTTMPSIDAMGTYVLVVTDNATGCTASATTNVNSSAVLPVANAGNAQLIDCNNPQIMLDGTGSETGTGITYLWTTNDGTIVSGEGTLTPTVSGQGTYTLLVTNTTNGCTQDATVDVLQNINQPNAVAGIPMVLTCTQDEVTLNGNGSSTGGNFTYQWNTQNGNILSGENTLTPLVNAAGTYQIIVTNTDNGCTQEAFVDVTSDGNLPSANAGTADDLTCNTSIITLSGSGSTGGNFTYLWTTMDGTIVSDETTFTPTVSATGTYQLLITDTDNGCTAISTVMVGENITPPIANAGLEVSIDCGSTQTTLDGSGSSSGGFSYQWTTQNGSILSGETTTNPTVDAVGTYVLTVTNDATGCTSSASADVISSVVLPVADAGDDFVIDCNTTETILDGSGSEMGTGITYLWTTMDGTILSDETTLTPTVEGDGTYTLTVSNGGNGCSAISNVVVTQDINQPTAVATTNMLITCTQDEVTLSGDGSSANGNFSYEWTTQNGNILSGEMTLNPIVNAAGTYQILVTNNDNGCTQIATVDVEVDGDIPTVNAGTADDLTCDQDQITLSGSGSTGNNFSFTWTTMDGTIVSGENTLTPTVSATGTYQIQITDSDNGCTAISTVTVGENVAPPEVLFPVIDSLSCTVDMVNINASNVDPTGNYTYTWTTQNGNIVSGETTLNPTVSLAGEYVLEMTNTDNGCMSMVSVDVEIDESAPVAAAGADTEVNCNNNEITLDGSGSDSGTNYSYEWTLGSTFIGNEISPTVNAAGTYQLQVTNIDNGCTSIDEVIVGEDFGPPNVNAGLPQTLSCSQTSLQLNGNGSSFGTEYTYEWTTQNGNIVSGENTLTPEINAAGDYQLEVTNTLNGCTAIESVNIAQDSNVPTAEAGDDDLLNCNITSLILDGGLSSSGIEFSYEWTTQNGNIVLGENTLNPQINEPGDYLLVVTNNTNGCTAPSSVTITLDDAAPMVEAGDSQFLSCTNNSVVLSGTGSSTGTDFTYEWVTQNGNILSGETTLSPEVNATGTYELIVTSIINGCTASDVVDITQDSSLPEAQAGDGFEITCQVFEGTLDGTASTTGTDITFEWTTQDGNIVSGENTLTPLVNAPGVYQLTLTNGVNGCTAISSATVIENANEPTAEAGSTMELNCNNETLTIVGTTTDTSTTLVYTWNSVDGNILSGENSLAPVVDEEGTYELTITNTATGCISTDNVFISSNFQAPTADAGDTDELNCTQAFATLDGGNSSMGAGFIYEWTTQNGNIVSGETTLTPDVNMAGDYELLVTDLANGCTAIEVVSITQSVELPTVAIANADDLTCTLTSFELDGSGSDSGTNFTYEWTTANGNIVSGENTINPLINEPGDYVLVVTNTSNDCTAETDIEVFENIAPPTAEAGATGLLTCAINETQLDGNTSSIGNNFTYEWMTQNGSIVSDETTLTPTIGGTGTYELIVTNTINGCTANDFVDVTSNEILPDAVAIANGVLTCTATSISLSGNGSATGTDITYTWTTTNGTIVSGENTINPTVGQIGDYTLLVNDGANGCSNSVTISVIEDVTPPTPLIDQTNNQTLDCINSSVVIDGSGSQPIGNVSYQWTTANGNILSGANTSNPEVDDDGEYILTVTNTLNGCTAMESITILQDLSVPQVSIGTPLTLTCDITEIDLTATNTSGGTDYSYQWTTTNGNIISGGTTLNPSINQPGTYQLTVIDLSSNCDDVETITVLENTTPPIAEAGAGGELDCQTTSVTLDGSGSSTGNSFTYEWATSNGNFINSTSSLITSVDAAGNYSLLVTNTLNGCTATDAVAVVQDTEAPSDIIYDLELPECHGDPGSIFIETVDGGTAPYLYSIDGENFYNGHIFTVEPGDYTLYAQDSEGCETSINFTIPELEPVSITLEEEVTIDLGDDYQIETFTNIPAAEISTVRWYPDLNLSCTDCMNPIVEQLFESLTYEVTITNIYGCKISAKIRVEVDKSRAIYIPNVFTPNGDDENDIFMIFAGDMSQIKQVNSFLVYDRWGETVFKSEGFPPMDPQFGWDGTFKGKPMNPQVFVYWAEIEFIDGYIGFYEGDVALRK